MCHPPSSNNHFLQLYISRWAHKNPELYAQSGYIHTEDTYLMLNYFPKKITRKADVPPTQLKQPLFAVIYFQMDTQEINLDPYKLKMYIRFSIIFTMCKRKIQLQDIELQKKSVVNQLRTQGAKLLAFSLHWYTYGKKGNLHCPKCP